MKSTIYYLLITIQRDVLYQKSFDLHLAIFRDFFTHRLKVITRLR